MTLDSHGGYGYRNSMPWLSDPAKISVCHDIQKYSSVMTTGKNKNLDSRNVVIMGKNTYNNIPAIHRPLKNRINVVISRSMVSENYHNGIRIHSDFMSALRDIKGLQEQGGVRDVFVIGGHELLSSIFEDYMYLCTDIILHRLMSDYTCDKHIHFENFTAKKIIVLSETKKRIKSVGFDRIFYRSNVQHPEYNYIKFLGQIKKMGSPVNLQDGNGNNVCLLNSPDNLEFDISEYMPILTTKNMKLQKMIHKFLFFLNGETNVNEMVNTKNIHDWKEETRLPALNLMGLGSYDEGEIGPHYGFQMRHRGETYTGKDNTEYEGNDQLMKLIEDIKQDPFTSDLMLLMWDEKHINATVRKMNQMYVQFSVSQNSHDLDCTVMYKNVDAFIELPEEIAFYGFLTKIICYLTSKNPRKLTFKFGRAYIRDEHICLMNRQLERTPLPMPILKFEGRITKIVNIDEKNLEIENYHHHSSLEPLSRSTSGKGFSNKVVARSKEMKNKDF